MNDELLTMDNAVGAKKWADFFRGRHGMKVRNAIEFGKRVEYTKGSRMVKFVNENSSKFKSVPDLSSTEDALEVGRLLISYGYLHRSERNEANNKILTNSRNNSFVVDGYYTWMYDGPTTIRNMMTLALIAATIGMTLFPIWPDFAKMIIWYMSVTFLIFVFTFSLIRFIAFFVMWMIGYDFWFLPNVYDDNLGVADSFKPLYSFVSTDSTEKYYRIVAIFGFIAFCVWVHNQPTDFDDYLDFTKQFTEDIYSGKMLSDVTQKQKENIDKVIPDFDDLLREEEEDEARGYDYDEEAAKEKDDEESLLDKLLNDDEQEDADEEDRKSVV